VIRAADRILSRSLQTILLAGVSAPSLVVVLDRWQLAVLLGLVFDGTRGRFRRTAPFAEDEATAGQRDLPP